ncbi:MAG: PilW family protein [Burkholderiales bacterium]|nr:PilW family protein [Burkholderiales bacterium]
MKPRLYPQSGLSLIELMIAMGLGLLLVAALGYLYVGQRQSWRMVEAVARLQENGRFALELLGQDLRMAGYAGCLSTAEARPQLLAKLDDPAKKSPFESLLNPFLQNGWLARGYGPGVAGTSSGWGVDRNLDGSVNATDRPEDHLANTDSLLVVGGSNPVITLGAGAMGSTESVISAAGNDRAFRQGELALIGDCERADVFRVSDDSAGYGSASSPIEHTNPLPHRDRRNTSNALSKAYGAGAQLMPLNLSVYYLRTNPAGRPALYRLPWARDSVGPGEAGWGTSEELIEGVEGMRIVYGEDTNNDGAVDFYRIASAVSNWSRVRAVRVSLLLVSPEDGVAPSAQTYVWDTDNDGELDDTVTAADRRLRMVFTSTYALRNRP